MVPLTENKAVQLLLRSFQFSQGSGSLQYLLFQYVANCHPDWRLEDVDRIVAVALPICLRVTQNGRHRALDFERSQHAIEQEVRLQVYKMQEIFDEDGTPRGTIVRSLLKEFVVRDYWYVVLKNAGLVRPQNGPFFSGRMFSYVCHYGFLVRPTGFTEFDHLFSDLREEIKHLLETSQKSDEQMTTVRYLQEIVMVHNQGYPDLLLSLPFMPSEC